MRSTNSPPVFRLVPVTDLDTAAQMKVREIRNEAGVRRWMYTDQLIGVEEHLGWINRLKTDPRQLVFAVMKEDHSPVGVASANALDRRHKKADWAFYLTEKARGGLGAAVEFFFIDFIFGSLGVEKLNCEVIEGNEAVVRLHKKFLFEEEGFRRSNLIKNGARVGVHFLGLTKEAWMSGKETLYEKYGSVLAKFDLSIQWANAPRLVEAVPIVPEGPNRAASQESSHEP